MRTTKKLNCVLRDLAALLEGEAARNPEFAERLEAITAALPERAAKLSGKAKQAESLPVPDVLAEFQSKGEAEFLFWLRRFDLPVLRAIVKRNGFDPAKASGRWTEPDRFVELIKEQVKARLERGSAFLGARAAGRPGSS
jgi:hypothetical protein